jgi:hypothetical protein
MYFVPKHRQLFNTTKPLTPPEIDLALLARKNDIKQQTDPV